MKLKRCSDIDGQISKRRSRGRMRKRGCLERVSAHRTGSGRRFSVLRIVRVVGVRVVGVAREARVKLRSNRG